MASYGYPESTFQAEAMDPASFDELRTNPATDEAASYADLLESASRELDSHLGGHFSTQASIDLARTHVFSLLVYGLHRRRATSPDYKIPDGAKDAATTAVRWAEGIGRKLLEAEPGAKTAPMSPSGAAYYAGRPTKFGRDQTDGL